MNPTDLVDRPNLRTDIPEFGPGDTVLFPTSTSPEVCQVVWGPEWVDDEIGGLPVCVGPASDADVRRDVENKMRRAEIQVAAQRLIRELKLPMKVSAVDWSDTGHESGRSTATVYFRASTRVDFRQLDLIEGVLEEFMLLVRVPLIFAVRLGQLVLVKEAEFHGAPPM